MSQPAIRASGLGKQYQIGGQQERYQTFRQAIVDLAAAPFRRFGRLSGRVQKQETFWALRDISFDVRPGEVVGFIGRNGAGKSTLLKVLSQITEPTEGFAEIDGRVASLLEVGTGFHPELTGRENVYLNAAILGMSRTEIRRKFDQIVAFAEIERFIDTPVKRYSSGMYVRLAFAVAAHLEPEILIVDEVLAVGDVSFQQKCLGKMQGVAKSGRTVLFVSHNMAAVQNLCERVFLLEQGHVTMSGKPSRAIAEYLKNPAGRNGSLRQRTDRCGSGEVRITAIRFRDADGNRIDTAHSGQDLEIALEFEATPGFVARGLTVSLDVSTVFDVPVFTNHNRLTGDAFGPLPQRGTFVCRFPRLPLPPATVRLSYSVLVNDEYIDGMCHAVELPVVAGKFFRSGEVPPASHGVCLVDGSWRVEELALKRAG